MKQRPTVTTRNMIKMLRPCTRASCFDVNSYHIFELESVSGQSLETYSFSFAGPIIHRFTPTKYNLGGGICASLATLKPVFDSLEFTPVAFITTNVQGPLLHKGFADLNTREYDMRKHLGFGLRTPELDITEIKQQSSIFTNMYKFILRDKKTNKVIPMPYYIEVPGSDNYFDKIATDKNIQIRFIQALRKMRSK